MTDRAIDHFIPLGDGSFWCDKCGKSITRGYCAAHLKRALHIRNEAAVLQWPEKRIPPPYRSPLPKIDLIDVSPAKGLKRAPRSPSPSALDLGRQHAHGSPPPSHPSPAGILGHSAAGEDSPAADIARSQAGRGCRLTTRPYPVVEALLPDIPADVIDLLEQKTNVPYAELFHDSEDDGNDEDYLLPSELPFDDTTFHDLLNFASHGWRIRGGQDDTALALLEDAAQQGLYSTTLGDAEAVMAELSDLMAKQNESQTSKDLPAPQQYSIRWYQGLANEPISAAGSMTVLQMCYAVMWLKVSGGMTGASVDSLCRLVSFGGLLDESNKMPRSLYLISGVLNIQHPDVCEMDMCDNGHCPYVYRSVLPHWRRPSHQSERCRICGNLRYLKRNKQLQAVRNAYILNLESVVKHLFGEPTFARYAGTRSQALLDSPAYTRVDSAHGGALSALSSAYEPVPVEGVDAPVAGRVAQKASEDSDSGEFAEVSDPDPLDEVMTGDGDVLTLLFALFVDGVQLHQHGRSTTTVVALKCLDLPGFLCNTDLACYPLAFIDGPKEPTNLSQFMLRILQQFKKVEPFGTADLDGNVTVTGDAFTIWDSFRQRERRVHPVLMFAFADTPARRCWALTCGHSGRSGCDKCGIRGTKDPSAGEDDSNPTVFAGYSRDTPALLWIEALQKWEVQSVRLGLDGKPDLAVLDHILMTDTKHRRRSVTAEDKTRWAKRRHPLPPEARLGGVFTEDPHSREQILLDRATLRCANCVACKAKWESRYNMANEEHKHLGVRGINPFQASGLLSYQYQSMFMEPISHTILNGIVRGFIDFICTTGKGFIVNGRPFYLPRSIKHRIDDYIKRIQLPSAYNRPSPTLCGVAVSKWYFEETNTFLEVTGAIAFCQVKDAIHPGLIEMWSLLRRFSLYFLHYRPGQHTREQLESVRADVYKFACFVEEHFKGKLLTCLLHRLFAHLPSQVAESMPGALLREDFGERVIRWTKSRITGHASKRAARASAAVCLAEMGLRVVKAQNPDVDQVLDRIQSMPRNRSQDSGDAYGVLLHQLKQSRDIKKGEDTSEMHRFLAVLDSMEAKVSRRAHRVSGPLELAGKLTRNHILGHKDPRTGLRATVDNEEAEVFWSDTATVQNGAWVVRTEKGSNSHGRTHTDHYVYVPFWAGRSQNPCIMKIDQIVLIRRKGMSWPDDEARLAVGTLWDRLPRREGAGLEQRYNDDPTTGACCVPRALFTSAAQKQKGYPWAVWLRQIHCPVAYIPGVSRDTFVTIGKMGFHGRRDLFLNS